MPPPRPAHEFLQLEPQQISTIAFQTKPIEAARQATNVVLAKSLERAISAQKRELRRQFKRKPVPTGKKPPEKCTRTQ